MHIFIHEIAALGTAACWAITGLIAADIVCAVGPFRFNLIRQALVIGMLSCIVIAVGIWANPPLATLLTLALSGIIGILIGDTLNFAAVGRIGPRRAGAIFALNAPIAALLGWIVLAEALPQQAIIGICITAGGVAVAILGRPHANAHRLESMQGLVLIGVLFGLGAAFGQATGALLARPVMAAGMDPYLASLLRVGASGLTMGIIAMTPFAPPLRLPFSRGVLILTAITAILGQLVGMTLFLFALQGGQTGIIATLSATSPVIILPLLWLRTGQCPTYTSLIGGLLAVAGLALIFLR